MKHRFSHRAGVIALATATLAAQPLLAQAASASDVPAAGDDEIIVTGIRNSLRLANDVKRDAP